MTSRGSSAVWIVALLIASAACSGVSRPDARSAVEVPKRADTVADGYLWILPSGADALLEIDVERLRDNAAVGPLVKALTDGGALDVGFDVLRDADSIVVASYDLGQPEAAQITIVRGASAGQIAGATPVGKDAVALADKRLTAKLGAVRRGEIKSLSSDAELLRIRTQAMPENAGGAAVRAVAVLDFDARVALAGQLDMDPVPRTLSVWGDVADDLAVVAVLLADDHDQSKKLSVAVNRFRDRIAASRPLARLVIGYVLRSMEITVDRHAVRVVLLIGPSRLEKIVSRLMGKMS